MLIRLFSVAKEVSQEHKRKGDAKPHGHHSKDGEERDGATGVFTPDEQVDEESNAKDNAGIESGSKESCRLPFLALHSPVEPARVVTSNLANR